MDIIKQLNWRYATKKFSDKKISYPELQELMEAARLTPSSYGLQPYRILIIDDLEVRNKLKEHSWGQEQVVEASHLLVLCSMNDVTDEDIQSFSQKEGELKRKSEDEINDYANAMKSKVARIRAQGRLDAWINRQIYIVLGNLMTTCALMGIDACPMEGFIPEKYDEILNLDKLGLKSVVLLPIGYRAEDDKYQHLPKTRKDLEELLYFI